MHKTKASTSTMTSSLPYQTLSSTTLAGQGAASRATTSSYRLQISTTTNQNALPTPPTTQLPHPRSTPPPLPSGPLCLPCALTHTNLTFPIPSPLPQTQILLHFSPWYTNGVWNRSSQRNPPQQLQLTMNPEFYCPIRGCTHSIDGTHAPFLTRTTLIRHLHSPTHSTTHHLVNHTLCTTAGIYTCCTSTCPASPKIFFSSLRALHDHCITIHPPPPSPHPLPTSHRQPLLPSHLIFSTVTPPHTRSTIGSTD